MRLHRVYPLILLLACVFSPASGMGAASVANPLDPVDTTGPRSTLEGFLQTMQNRYSAVWGKTGFVARYLNSNALFPENQDIFDGISYIRDDRKKAAKYFDLSAIPKAIVDQAAWRLTIQLKEVLDRLDLPTPETIPDGAMMVSAGQKRWTIPGSEIAIAQIESGPKAGQYLFTQDTVSQIPAFYESIKTLPYKPGASEGMYAHVFHEPSGLALALSAVIPPRWFYLFPAWTKILVLDQPLWRWLAIGMVWALMVGIFWASIKLTHYKQKDLALKPSLWDLLPSSTLLLMAPAIEFIMGEVLRVSPSLSQGFTLVLWAIFYLALTWFAWNTGRLIAETLIGIERMNTSSTDSQLIRLFLRLVTILVAIAILIEGANRLGLPSYSIMAGLGIGGLAAALAGQQALANLLGSLIIMFEKPFRIGHTIKSGNIKGRVEEVGFRSTRIRTSENTLMSIPSSTLINNPIENLSLRKSWQINRTLHLAMDTPIEAMRAFETEVRELIQRNTSIKPESIRFFVSAIGLNGYEILLEFSIKEPDQSTRLNQCDEIFLGIAWIASDHNIQFTQGTANPTQT